MQGEAEGPATRIDAIWAAAQAETPTDESAGLFLDALLAEGLICPVWSQESGDPAAQSGGDGFAPVTVERDGMETFCLFDSVERMGAADLEAAEFVAAPGRLFFQLAADAGAQIAFNPGVAVSDSLFSAEMVAMVAALAAAAEEEELAGAGETVEVLAPPPPPAALLAALSARLEAARGAGEGVAEAWLVSIRRSGVDGAERVGLTLALGVAAEADSESGALGALARDLSRLGGVLAGPGGLDVALLEQGERALEAARKVGLGLMSAP